MIIAATTAIDITWTAKRTDVVGLLDLVNEAKNMCVPRKVARYAGNEAIIPKNRKNPPLGPICKIKASMKQRSA